jgi:hypothetical protein
MNLDELVVAWKNHGAFLTTSLRDDTLVYLLREKSQTVLERTRGKLTFEFLLVITLFIGFDVLFYIVDIPLGLARVSSLIIVNVTLMIHLWFYINAIRKCRLVFKTNLEKNLRTIISGLSQFEHRRKLFNVPVIALCVVMFAVSVNHYFMIPWMIVELFLWRSFLRSNSGGRFSDLISDLKFTLGQIESS